jgi:hypothetical protein
MAPAPYCLGILHYRTYHINGFSLGIAFDHATYSMLHINMCICILKHSFDSHI